MKKTQFIFLRFFGIFSFCSFMLWSSCREDEDPCKNLTYENGAWILNEGTFNSNTATVSFVGNNSCIEIDAYAAANASTALGDVGQSIAFSGDKAYIVVNNSNKVVVVDISTMAKITEITGFVAPRYILPLPNNTAWVSNIYSDLIHVVDLQTNTIVDSFSVECPNVGDFTPCQTEQMAYVNGNVYVVNMNSNEVLVFELNTRTLLTTLPVAPFPASIAVDNSNDIWVMCSGSYLLPSSAALIKISTLGEQIVRNIGISGSPNSLAIHSNNTAYYVNNNRIVSRDLSTIASPEQLVLDSQGGTFYGLSIQLGSNTLWVCDAGSFSSQGKVYVVDLQTNAIKKTYDVGIVPSKVYFR